MRFFKKRDEPPAHPSKPGVADAQRRPASPPPPPKSLREPAPTKASPPRPEAVPAKTPPPKASTVPPLPSTLSTARTPTDEPRWSDLLSTAIAEQEREMKILTKVEELVFFEREIGGLANTLQAAFRLGQAERVRPLLERLVDVAADLEEVVIARFSPPPLPPTTDSPDRAAVHSGTDGGATVTEADADSRVQSLESMGEAVIDEILTIRGALVDDEEMARLFAKQDDSRVEEARYQIGRVLKALNRLLHDCVERLLKAPAPEEPPVPFPSFGEIPAPETPAISAAPLSPPAPPPPPLSVAPVAPAPVPLPAAPNPPPPPPLPAPPLAPAEPAEAKGLTLVSLDGPVDVFLEPPPPPDVEHRSEEEAIHHLQGFFNERSGDSGLSRADDQELERMAQQLVKIVCPDHTFSKTDFAARLKRLKETFALRKKLHNALTLPEFKAYFRPR